MIRSVAEPETALVVAGEVIRVLPLSVQTAARRKLRQLDAAERLNDLTVPRGNRLEQLKGFTPPRYSIRINDQWRLTFRWSDGGADDVRIEDYHR